jgi:hypothetical protein
LFAAKPTRKHFDSQGVTTIGNITGNPINGVATFQLTNEITGTAGTKWYAIRVIDPQGHPLTYRFGELVIAST